MVNVAEVSTVVAVPNSCVRNSPATDSGATRNTGRLTPLPIDPRVAALLPAGCSSWSSHTTSARSGIAGTKESSTRAAVSLISVSPAIASARAAAALGSFGAGSMAERAVLAASRSAVR